jgi:hypothetical protein
MFVGSYLSGWVVDQYTQPVGETVLHNWQPIWLIPAAMSVVVLVLFAILFHHREEPAKPARV